MATPLRLERPGPSIRAVLAELDPAACTEFEAEFRIALAETDVADDFDLPRHGCRPVIP